MGPSLIQCALECEEGYYLDPNEACSCIPVDGGGNAEFAWPIILLPVVVAIIIGIVTFIVIRKSKKGKK